MKHISEDLLERRAMRRLTEPESGPVEEHLSICQSCRDHLEAEIEFVTAVKAAVAQLPSKAKEAKTTKR